MPDRCAGSRGRAAPLAHRPDRAAPARAWGLVWMLGLLAGYRVRPHLLGADELRLRNGPLTDVPVALSDVARVRHERMDLESAVRSLQLRESDGTTELQVVSPARSTSPSTCALRWSCGRRRGRWRSAPCASSPTSPARSSRACVTRWPPATPVADARDAPGRRPASGRSRRRTTPATCRHRPQPGRPVRDGPQPGVRGRPHA